MVLLHGVAAQFGANFILSKAFVNTGLLAGGDYPLQSESLDIPAIELIMNIRLTVFGAAGEGENRKPFTLPTGCTGPLRSTISVDSYQEPGNFVGEAGDPEARSPSRSNAAGEPVNLTGCSASTFPPTIDRQADTTNASSASG